MALVEDAGAAFTVAGNFSVTLPAASSSANLLVVTIAGNMTVATPSGWTLRTSQVNDMGHYMWTRQGDGASSYTFNATGQGVWYIAEVAAGTYLTASGQNNVASASTYTTTSLTPTAGDRTMIASIGSLTPNNTNRTASAWLNSYVEESDFVQPTADRPMQATASLDVTANGSTAYSTGCTFSRNLDAKFWLKRIA